jgi:hypothetical protein
MIENLKQSDEVRRHTFGQNTVQLLFRSGCLRRRFERDDGDTRGAAAAIILTFKMQKMQNDNVREGATQVDRFQDSVILTQSRLW